MVLPLPRLLGWCIGFGITILVPARAVGQGLELRWTGDEIKFAAPKLHFLKGSLLERVRDGVSIPFSVQLQVTSPDRITVYRRWNERATLSYDIWEERFALLFSRKRAPSLLKSPAAVETELAANVTLSGSDIPGGRPLLFRLDIRVDDPEDDAPSATTLRGIIEALSRTGKPRDELRWSAEAGPVTLEDLRRSSRTP